MSDEVDLPDKPRRRTGWAVAGLVVLGLLVVVGVAHRPLIEWKIRKEALARGVELDFAGLSITPGRVVLRQTHVKLVEVPGVKVDIVEIGVDLDGLDPTRVEAIDADVHVIDPVDAVLASVQSFAAKYGKSLSLPMRVQGDFSLAPPPGASTVLSGVFEADGHGDVRFDGKVAVSKANLGKLQFHRAKEGSSEMELVLPFAKEPRVKLSTDAKFTSINTEFFLFGAEKPQVKVLLDMGTKPMTVVATLSSIKVDEVFQFLQRPVPDGFSGVIVDGDTALTLASDEPSDAHRGTAKFVLTGWTPPHPRELDGIVYGRTTQVRSTFEVPQDLSELRLGKLVVEAGAFRLGGSGNVLRDGFSARLKLDLSGQIACSELGASAIDSYVEGLMGHLLRGAARMTMGGSVKMRVLVDADSNAPDKAKIDQSVDVGCRLR